MTGQLTLKNPSVWDQRVDQMGLSIEASPVWPLIEKLHAELDARGIRFRPGYFVSNEWGCPDGEPLIGVPFYLVDPRIHEIELDYADDLEDDERILAGLRHEMGHALNYAYRLHDDPEWQERFGAFLREYHDDYRANPFSRRYVRHLPGWYAQKHPDEDFAETFAVWLTPGLDWRERYQGWEALAKLEYVDRLMARVAASPALVDPSTLTPDPDELAFTVGEFYRDRQMSDAAPVSQIGAALDDDLRELFAAGGIGTDAATLVHDRRTSIMRAVSAVTGARQYVVKSVIQYIVDRLGALNLRAAPGKDLDAVVGVTAVVSTLTHKFLDTGNLQVA